MGPFSIRGLSFTLQGCEAAGQALTYRLPLEAALTCTGWGTLQLGKIRAQPHIGFATVIVSSQLPGTPASELGFMSPKPGEGPSAPSSTPLWG